MTTSKVSPGCHGAIMRRSCHAQSGVVAGDGRIAAHDRLHEHRPPDGEERKDTADHRESGGDVHGAGEPVDEIETLPRGEPGRRGQDCDREESRDAGHGVVDGGGDAGVGVLDRAQHGRGERSHGERKAQAEHDQGGEHRLPVGGAGLDPPEQHHADGDDQRPDRHRDARTDALGERAGAGREQQHARGDRQQRCARLQCRVAEIGLEVHHQQERHRAQRRVHREGDGVRTRELLERKMESGSSGSRCAPRP